MSLIKEGKQGSYDNGKGHVCHQGAMTNIIVNIFAKTANSSHQSVTLMSAGCPCFQSSGGQEAKSELRGGKQMTDKQPKVSLQINDNLKNLTNNYGIGQLLVSRRQTN